MKRAILVLLFLFAVPVYAQEKTQKPPLHGSHWMGITGKPLAATAGAMIFQKGGNAVDAAAAMIAATCTMWDTLSWGGETQALIYNPKTKKVIGINALGVAPTGATPEYFRGKKMRHPPEYGPLAAVTPGTPGGIITMVAEYGKLSLKDVLAPAIEMADGYAMERQLADTVEKNKERMKQWPYTKELFFGQTQTTNKPLFTQPNATSPSVTASGSQDLAPEAVSGPREGPQPGSMFRQPDLAATLRKLVEAEQDALKKKKSRKEAIYAAYDRFYKGDIAKEIVRGVQEQGGLFTMDDLAKWRVHVEEPVKTTYKGIDVYKLNAWTQGPAMLQALNILENFNLHAMGYNSARYINAVYQAISMAFADRDFYYGDTYVAPEEPVSLLLSKDYARSRAADINREENDPNIMPGDPFAFVGQQNPFPELLRNWRSSAVRNATSSSTLIPFDQDPFYRGTTSVETADTEGWAVSVTPSGGWVPAVVAGHTGIGLSQRMQSFVTDASEGPYNVVAPGKHPRVTLTPTLAMKDGLPWMVFSVQGGDSQDQNLLQFFLNVVEFGMTVQEATEAPNFNSFQMRSSFGRHEIQPGRILLNAATPPWVRGELQRMGYTEVFEDRTSGPINAILIDRAHGTFWGGSSNHGEDYGIGW
jgi:gamma-glutamyltranspeptidase/glutathione hydrolase